MCTTKKMTFYVRCPVCGQLHEIEPMGKKVKAPAYWCGDVLRDLEVEDEVVESPEGAREGNE